MRHRLRPLPKFILALSLFLHNVDISAQTAEEFNGVARIVLEHADGKDYRAGLVVGGLPSMGRGEVILVPEDALYSPDDDLVRLVSNTGSADGQVLELPIIDLPNNSGGVQSLAAVALESAPRAATVACIAQVYSGQPAQIAAISNDTKAELTYIPGTVIRISADQFAVEFDSDAGTPRVGAPIMVSAQPAPVWRVIGIVNSIDETSRVNVLTIREIYQALSSEFGTWALQPFGLCDATAQEPELGINETLLSLVEKPITRLFEGQENPRVIAEESWPEIRAYLSRANVEHYFFTPGLSDAEKLGQFWSSFFSLMNTSAQLRSAIAAPNPIARIRVQRPNEPAERGWAVAMSQTKAGILLLTANHLVKEVPATNPEILVFFPALQGFGFPAFRWPFVDESLDLALIFAPVPDEGREQLFGIYQTVCPGDVVGSVEVPITTWGWRRERQRGTARAGARPGELRLSGLDVKRGFSGSALLRNGNQIAGIVTKDLSGNQGSIAASIHAGLPLIPFGQPGIRTSAEYFGQPGIKTPADCKPTTLVEQASRYLADIIVTRKRIPAVDRALLVELFGEAEASRIHLGEIPSIPYGDSADSEDSYTPDEIEELVKKLEIGCAALQRQRLVSNSVDSNRAPDDKVRCDLPRQGDSLLTLRRDTNVAICEFGRGNAMLYSRGKFWDATFIQKCDNIEPGWHEPADWLEQAAAGPTSPSELVRIPAGPFWSGDCNEEMFFDTPTLVCKPSGRTSKLSGAYQIQRYPVTIAEFARCVSNGQCRYQRPEHDIGKESPSVCHWGRPGRARRPMNCINWTDAAGYCAAIGGSLPSETEWEKAARGTDGRQNPWGNDERWGTGHLYGRRRGPMQVGLAPDLASPYGVEDIGWNIHEWTSDNYVPNRSDLTAEQYLGANYSEYRAVRGQETLSHRWAYTVDKVDEYLGFRCSFPSGQ